MGHCTVASVSEAMFYLDICQFRKVFVEGIFLFSGFCKLDVHEVFLFLTWRRSHGHQRHLEKTENESQWCNMKRREIKEQARPRTARLIPQGRKVNEHKSSFGPR